MLLKNPVISNAALQGLGNELFTASCPSGTVNVTGVPEPAYVDSMLGISQWEAANCKSKAWVAAQKAAATAPAPVSQPVQSMPVPQQTYSAPAPAPAPVVRAPTPQSFVTAYTAQSDDTPAPVSATPAQSVNYSLQQNAPFVPSAPETPITDETTSQVAPVVVASSTETSPWLLIALAAGAFLLMSGKKSGPKS